MQLNRAPADDEAREGGRDDADVGEAEVERRHEHLVGQRVQEWSQARGLTGDLSGNESVQLEKMIN